MTVRREMVPPNSADEVVDEAASAAAGTGQADATVGAGSGRRGGRPRVGSTWPGAPERRPWAVAFLFLLPYVLLSVCWAFSNPPGAAPDESDHLVKALGNSAFNLGAPGPPAAAGAAPVLKRNASTTRIFQIPASLSPTGYTCYAFDPAKTAECLPRASEVGGTVDVASAVGDYPPFLYLPIGWMASLGSTAPEAFILGRLVVAGISFGLLLLGATHLTRWLGRKALVAYAVVLTPMAVYVCSSVSTSGIEFAGASAVAAVVVVAMRRPESLDSRATHWTMGVCGAALALSRQLGVVALGVLVLLLVFGVGWRHVWSSFRRSPGSSSGAIALLVIASSSVMWWELTYDHPSGLGPVFTWPAFSAFVDRFYYVVGTGIGNFGYLDTALPNAAVAVWVIVWLVIIGGSLLVARRAAFFSILGMLALTVVLTAVVYMSVFFPVAATVQGRHVLPLFVVCPILASVTLLRHLGRTTRTTGRLLLTVAAMAGVLQGLSVYWNARRYAVGLDGPLWFLGHSEWSPPLGWVLWLIIAVVASAGLVIVLSTFALAADPTGGDAGDAMPDVLPRGPGSRRTEGERTEPAPSFVE